MWIPLAMAATQMVMQERQNQQAARDNKAQAQSAAAQTQFSPWTGHGRGQANFQEQGDMLGAGIQGAASGAAMAQSYEAGEMNKKLGQQKLQMNQMKINQGNGYTNTSPYTMANAQMGRMS